VIHWDPDTYLAAADERARPFVDLISRVGATNPRAVVDLGCGPGNLTMLLRERWPNARVHALDSSPDMVAAARTVGIDAVLADVTGWTPGPEDDVVVCNAVLHWVPGHVNLLRQWAAALPEGAWLAIQVPGNFGAPSHQVIRDQADTRRWHGRLTGLLRDADAVLTPAGYATALVQAGCRVDAWETTYLHRLHGRDPVLRWLTGTALRPVRSALDDAEWAQFTAELSLRLAAVYPAESDGTTWFPFRRVFVVARR
jgi:trans-aconitate 2-methyltransferase